MVFEEFRPFSFFIPSPISRSSLFNRKIELEIGRLQNSILFTDAICANVVNFRLLDPNKYSFLRSFNLSRLI